MARSGKQRTGHHPRLFDMKRRNFIAGVCGLIGTGTVASAHHINRKPAGEVCRGGSCSMCQHNSKHRQGYDHENGQWHKRGTKPAAKVTDLHDSTPMDQVEILLEILRPTKADLLFDIGCGDGRICIGAAKRGCRAVGIEIDPQRADLARQNVASAGLSHLVALRVGDARKLDISGASLITMFLYPDLISELLPYTYGARAVASINHPIPDSKEYKAGDWSIFVRWG